MEHALRIIVTRIVSGVLFEVNGSGGVAGQVPRCPVAESGGRSSVVAELARVAVDLMPAERARALSTPSVVAMERNRNSPNRRRNRPSVRLKAP